MLMGDAKQCLYHAKYIYPSKLHMTLDETEKWIAHETCHYHENALSREYVIDRVIYWRLSLIACHLIKSDTKYFESIIPTLQQFWDYILFYRANPKRLDALVQYIQEIGVKKSSEIFERIHREYVASNKNTKYHALYQTVNPWRKKFNEKAARFQNYQKSKSS